MTRSEPAPAPGDRRSTFGARLRRFRESAGLSQVALAGDRLHPSYVSLLEADRRVPTSDVVSLLAARLGVTPGELTGDIDTDLEQPLVLAEASLGLGRPAEAVALLEPFSAGFTAERFGIDSLIFRAGDAYATALERLGRLDEATVQLEELRRAADNAPGRLPWLSITVSLMRCYRDAGDLGRSIDLGEDAVRRCEGQVVGQLDGHAALVSTLAGAYSERGDLMRASLLLDDLLTTTSQSGSLEDQAFAYWNAAITAAERGRPRDGLRLAEQATALLDLGNNMRAKARIQVSLAWVKLAQRPPEAEAARTLLRDALPSLRQHAGALSVATAETELARCELLLERPDIARRHAQSALKRLAPENRVERARSLTALGAAFVALGERAAGVASLEEAAEALAEVGAARQAAAVWRQLSDVFRALGDSERALDAADRALDVVGLASEPMAPVGQDVAALVRTSGPRARARS